MDSKPPSYTNKNDMSEHLFIIR